MTPELPDDKPDAREQPNCQDRVDDQPERNQEPRKGFAGVHVPVSSQHLAGKPWAAGAASGIPWLPANSMSLPGIDVNVFGQAIAKDLQRNLSRTFAPLIDMSMITATFSEQLQATTSALLAGYRSWASELVKTLPSREWLSAAVPDNMREVWDEVEWDDMMQWATDESLPIGWVMPPDLLRRLGEADGDSRLGVLADGQTDIFERTVEQLAAIDSSNGALQAYLRAAERIRDGIVGGFSDLAQSYAAVVIEDCVMTWFFTDKGRFVSAPSPRNTKAIPEGELPILGTLLVLQLRGLYRSAYRSKGDPTPMIFTRNGAAHYLGEPQYTELNATLGFAHVVSLLRQFDVATRAGVDLLEVLGVKRDSAG